MITLLIDVVDIIIYIIIVIYYHKPQQLTTQWMVSDRADIVCSPSLSGLVSITTTRKHLDLAAVNSTYQ